jgi:two-component system cell cycle response regulator
MTGTILVVDDHEPNLKLLEAKLINEYYTVITAFSGKEALDILAKSGAHSIDVILLDVMMPEMDGFTVCKMIKSNPLTSHIPVVMVTALSGIEDRVKGLESGADDFLIKPINDIKIDLINKSIRGDIIFN